MGQFGMQGPQNMNVNQQMIRPLLLNMTVVFLFLLPLVTMRTYAEEKRSGTIELLLTSPLTDLQIVLGKFLGAMALYGAMLLVTLVHFGLLFVFGNPDWKPLAAGVPRPAPVRRLLHLDRPVHLEPDEEPDRRWRGDLRRVPAAVGHRLDRPEPGATGESILKYMSMTEHLDDFVKGVIDTKHLVYYLSFIAFGLFLTVRSVDTERWRG